MISLVLDRLKEMDRKQVMELADKSGVNWQVIYKISLGLTKDPRIQTLQAVEPHIGLDCKCRRVSPQ